MIHLVVVRHCQTDWNKERKVQGITDIPLNEEGIKQAINLKDVIDLKDIRVCYSSPLKRALKTSEILLDNSDIDIIYDDRLVERSFGDFEGKVITEEDANKYWNYNEIYSEGNIERLDDCLLRAKDFLEYLKQKHDNETILIVSHSCLIKCLYFNLIGYDKSTDFTSFRPVNGKVYHFDIC